MRAIWIITIGWWTAALWLVAGVMLAMTIIGLPLAWLCFKLAGKAFDPWAGRAEPRETVTRIIHEHHYYDHRVIEPTGPKGGEPMPVAEPETDLILDDYPVANDVVVPFRRRA